MRPWWPVTVALGLVSPRRRRVLAATLALGLTDVVRRARRDGVGWRALPAVVTAHLLDDLAYSVGVLEGVARTGRYRVLLPRVRWRTST